MHKCKGGETRRDFEPSIPESQSRETRLRFMWVEVFRVIAVLAFQPKMRRKKAGKKERKKERKKGRKKDRMKERKKERKRRKNKRKKRNKAGYTAKDAPSMRSFHLRKI